MLRRLDYRPYPFDVKYANFNFELGEERTLVSGTLFMERKAASPANEPLVLHLGETVLLRELKINGVALAPAEYSRAGDTITIPNNRSGMFMVYSVVEINPSANKTGEGLYLTDGMFCTQCEAEGFRQITPYPDRPDVLAPMTTRIVAERKYPILLSNGNKTEEGVTGDGRHFVTWKDPAAKACYLFALVAGDLAVMEDEFVTMLGRKVACRLYSDTKATLAKCRFAMASLKRAMRWDEVAFGREYDLDLYMVVAVSSFNMGAMENRGLNVFNLKYVSGDQFTATDAALIGIEGVIGHEYFHNWSGNLVTCRDWFQLSLKEGFTVFRDQEFSRSIWGIPEMIKSVRGLREQQFAEDAGPLAHPIRPDEAEEISNFYTWTVYEKGAEVVRMIQTILGPKKFREGTDLYFSRHFGKAATCEDFVKAMKDASGVDLTQFRRWYSQAGTPTATVRSAYDHATQILALTVEQSCPATLGQSTKEPFHIPIRIGFLDETGCDQKDVLVLGHKTKDAFDPETGLLHVKEARQTFVFSGVLSKSVVSLNRGFSAPVKIDYPYTMTELCFLMRHDSDPFNRWDAGQTAAMRVLLSMVEDVRAGKVPSPDFEFTQAIGGLITAYFEGRIDTKLFAEMISLPSEAAMANASDVVYPDAIHAARESLICSIAEFYHWDLSSLYTKFIEPYVFDPEHVARRKVKNICLAYLCAADGRKSFLDHASLQLRMDQNMTDELAALSVLTDSPLRSHKGESDVVMVEDAIGAFYEKHKDDRNTIDSWFGVQAMSSRTDVGRIRALMKHPEFSMKVPNRVYAVIRTFTGGNPVQFHHRSGSGYAFLAEIIRELDKFNPQVAARLVDPLTEWKRYDVARQELMKQELLRLSEVKLSKGVMEKITKSLA